MEQYITEFSKYLIALFMALYTYECFAVFRFRTEERRNGIYVRQNILMFLVHFLCYISIILRSGKSEYIFFFAFQQIALFTMIVLFQMLYPKSNRLLINNMCMLLAIGFVILIRISYDKAVRQFIIVVCSMILSMFVPYLIQRIKNPEKLTWLYAGVGIVSLAAVLVAGAVTNGSKLSFSVAGVSFQPSEFVKIVFVFCMAAMLKEAQSFAQIALSAFVAAAHVLILVMSRDLGSALIFFVAYIVMLYCATGKAWYPLLGLLAGAGASVVAYHLFSHVQVRVQAWKDPWSVIDGAGYQITQSLFAIGCGNWFGLGICQGAPKSIPYVETDFVFSAIAEELGVIFAICLILVCVSCFMMFMNIAMQLNGKFPRLLVVGLGATYIFQIFLTIGGGTKFIPLTGVTLPFISYGGSSVFATFLVFTIVEGFYELQEHPASRRAKAFAGRQIMHVSYVFAPLFLVLSAYIAIYAATHEEELVNNSYNPRQQMLNTQNTRGTIYSADGEVLAQTVADENKQSKREYPFANLFSHAVGYASNGRMGVEAQMNYYLINSNIPFSEKAVNEREGKKNPGDNVYTTFDTLLQKTAADALGVVYDGAIVAMNPKTGEIYAMVSMPDFDPNEIDNIWEQVIADKESSVLLNRVSQGLYPAGSTFKIVTALEYIRENPDTYENYKYQCNGSLTHGEDRISCYHGSVHNLVDLQKSFAKSCNTSFANIGLTFEQEKFGKTLDKLYFNKPLPVGFASNPSSLLIDKETSDSDMMQSAIGQGKTQISPLHLAMITSAVANDGEMMTPYVVDRVESADGTVVKQYTPSSMGKVMTAEETAVLKDYMEEVVKSGTGTKLSGLSYTAAGKTGSAEYNRVKGDSHAWFTGFAPAEDPEIVVTVIIEGAGSGGDYAVPIAKRVFDAYFQ